MPLISMGKTPAGQDALLIGGHEVPMSALAIGATAVGGLLVLRARKKGGNVAAAGQPANSVTATNLGPYDPANAGVSADSEAISQLQNELAMIEGALTANQTPAGAATVGTGAQSPGASTTPLPHPGPPHPVPPAQPKPNPIPIATHPLGRPHHPKPPVRPTHHPMPPVHRPPTPRPAVKPSDNHTGLKGGGFRY